MRSSRSTANAKPCKNPLTDCQTLFSAYKAGRQGAAARLLLHCEARRENLLGS